MRLLECFAFMVLMTHMLATPWRPAWWHALDFLCAAALLYELTKKEKSYCDKEEL